MVAKTTSITPPVSGKGAGGMKSNRNNTPTSVLGSIDLNAIADTSPNTPAKGSLDCLAALTATPVRAIIDDPSSAPDALAEVSPLKGWQCKRRRTASAAAVPPMNPAGFPPGHMIFMQPMQMFSQVMPHMHNLIATNAALMNQQDPAQMHQKGLVLDSRAIGEQQPFASAFTPAPLPAGQAGPAGANANAAATTAAAQQQTPDALGGLSQPGDNTAAIAPGSLSSLPGIASQEVLQASTKWRDLLIADVKGRLAALRRSKQRVSRQRQKWSNEAAADHLMGDMERELGVQQLKLEKQLKDIVEMSNQVGKHPEALLSMAYNLNASCL